MCDIVGMGDGKATKLKPPAPATQSVRTTVRNHIIFYFQYSFKIKLIAINVLEFGYFRRGPRRGIEKFYFNVFAQRKQNRHNPKQRRSTGGYKQRRKTGRTSSTESAPTEEAE